MGKPIANSSNLGRGWRNKNRGPEPQSGGNVIVKDMDSGRKKCDYPTGNSHRARHDDGSRHTRRRTSGHSTKHKSPHTHG